ncbi:MAG: pyridoxal phosphate-dependent aminotransferase [Candidatus Competibacterales bacterium]
MPTISQRTRTLGTEHAFTVLAEVNALVAQGADIISFAIGQPDFATPDSICRAAVAAIEAGKHGYTPSAGIPELRAAAAEFLSQTRGMNVEARDVVVANGAKPFIMYTLLATTDYGAGHEVLYPAPGFPIYESQIRACGAVPVALPLEERHAFAFSPGDLRAKLNERTRLLILNSPHNPTGRTWSRRELSQIAEVLRDYPQCWVLSDEIYSQMVHDGEFASIATQDGMAERTVVVDGASKSYAMTGWRLGFAANPLLAPHFANWVTNTDSCASSISQWAALEALTGDQSPHRAMMARFAHRRDLIVERLNALEGVSALRPGGAFYVWPNVTALCQRLGLANAEALRRRWLYEAHVAVLADSQFGAPSGQGHFLRFSYATADAQIEEGIQRLAHWIDAA